MNSQIERRDILLAWIDSSCDGFNELTLQIVIDLHTCSLLVEHFRDNNDVQPCWRRCVTEGGLVSLLPFPVNSLCLYCTRM